MLAALLSLGRIFEIDDEDGSLEVLATGPLPLELIAAAKSLAHWLTDSPALVSARAGTRPAAQPRSRPLPLCSGSLIVGTPAISFIGAICAALTLRSATQRAAARTPGPAALCSRR